MSVILKSINRYAEFFWTFTWRNVRLQYNNFWLGLFWGVVQPLLMSTIFYITLNKGVGADFSHYFLYVYSGFIIWNVFFGGLSQAYISFLQNDSLVKNIYFPRYLLPLTYLMAKLVDLAIAFVILIVMLLVSDIAMDWGRFIFFSVLSLIILAPLCSGIYLAFAVICVRFRGFQMILPFMSQAIFFTAPVIYDTGFSIENEWIRFVFWFNPITGVLNLFRAGIFQKPLDLWTVVIYVLFAIIIFTVGFIWFKIEDKHLIDRL